MTEGYQQVTNNETSIYEEKVVSHSASTWTDSGISVTVPAGYMYSLMMNVYFSNSRPEGCCIALNNQVDSNGLPPIWARCILTENCSKSSFCGRADGNMTFYFFFKSNGNASDRIKVLGWYKPI